MVCRGKFLIAVAYVQTSAPPKTGNLEFRLQGENAVAGIPRNFTFQLVNNTDHDVHLPEPTIACTDPYKGEIELQVAFTPLNRGVRDLRGAVAPTIMADHARRSRTS